MPNPIPLDYNPTFSFVCVVLPLNSNLKKNNKKTKQVCGLCPIVLASSKTLDANHELFVLFIIAKTVDAQDCGKVFDVVEMGVVFALTFQLNL